MSDERDALAQGAMVVVVALLVAGFVGFALGYAAQVDRDEEAVLEQRTR